jgi:hypothetical protein
MQDHEFVFNEYNKYRKHIKKNKSVISNAKIKKIKAILKQTTKDDLILLFEYLSNSQDDYVKFINGDNEAQRFYGTLDNLFRKSKIKEKISRAKKWKAQQNKNIPTHDLFMPFMLLEKSEVDKYYQNEFNEYEESSEEEEPNITLSNLQMSIFAQQSKDNEQK